MQFSSVEQPLLGQPLKNANGVDVVVADETVPTDQELWTLVSLGLPVVCLHGAQRLWTVLLI